ncbi:hypothetical protein AB1Y20_016351 [Prymnesium parvum]|uniref:Uncharacterized protein n=1 Tax=Prymnesium parvum TaxID=97485 RepID=A0AB34ICG9_PRYPA
MSEEDEVAELKAMMAAGPPSARGQHPKKNGAVVAKINKSDDFMSAHVKNLRAAATNDRINQTTGHQSHMYADNFMMSHLRKVRDQSMPNKSWQGTASQLPADNFLLAHNKKLQQETGPKVYKSTKVYGVAPSVRQDTFMMAHVAQVEKGKKGGVSSIGMAPKIGAESFEVEFVRGMAENNSKGESSIGMGAKITADSFMNVFNKQLSEELKPRKDEPGPSHMPVDSFMQQHLKHVHEISHMHKQPHEKAQLQSDSFMIDFHKKSKEANNVKQEMQKQTNLPADSYLLLQMKEIKEMNQKPTMDSTHEKPRIGTDDFTMSVLRKAQKEVMSY